MNKMIYLRLWVWVYLARGNEGSRVDHAFAIDLAWHFAGSSSKGDYLLC